MRFYDFEEWAGDRLSNVPWWGWVAGIAVAVGGCWLADWLGYGPQ